MALHTQRVSTLAWQDERHVRDNRALYREKFDLFTSVLADCWPIKHPMPVSFYIPRSRPLTDCSMMMIKRLPNGYIKERA